MNLDEAKSLWSSELDTNAMPTHTLPDTEILRLVQEKSDAFDQKIWRRDLLESIAAVAIILFFGWMAVQESSWIARSGALIVIGGAAYIFWRLRQARIRYMAPSMDRPVAQVLRTERDKVDEQIYLLENVLWWYIAPIAIGVIIIAIGDSGWSGFTLIYSAVVVLASAGIYALNQRAVRQSLRPRRNELTRLLNQVEENADSNSD